MTQVPLPLSESLRLLAVARRVLERRRRELAAAAAKSDVPAPPAELEAEKPDM